MAELEKELQTIESTSLRFWQAKESLWSSPTSPFSAFLLRMRTLFESAMSESAWSLLVKKIEANETAQFITPSFLIN
jgi:hypothetical protein